jgi:hypothetical protein
MFQQSAAGITLIVIGATPRIEHICNGVAPRLIRCVINGRICCNETRYFSHEHNNRQYGETQQYRRYESDNYQPRATQTAQPSTHAQSPDKPMALTSQGMSLNA